jgi:aspartyl-tRNA(Asn)/glutamyl-tRNA(Gln) amidotransferase subunit A
LISPTSPVPAFRLGERTADPLQMYLADIFTNAANLAGICGISLPCGFARSDDGGHQLPIGLQLLGKALDEARILQIAYAYEQSTEWHKHRPPMTRENVQQSVPSDGRMGSTSNPEKLSGQAVQL